MKRKRRQRITTIVLSIISLIFLTVSMIAPFLNQMNNSPVQTPFIPTPTHELFAGEEVLYVSGSLPSYFGDELRIVGGVALEREFQDSNGQLRTELSMALSIRGEEILAYKGLEWDYSVYHIRVLDIEPRGLAILAISENR